LKWWQAVVKQLLDENIASSFALVSATAINFNFKPSFPVSSKLHDLAIAQPAWKVVHWAFRDTDEGVQPVVAEPLTGSNSFSFGILQRRNYKVAKTTGYVQVIFAYDFGDYYHKVKVQALQAFVRGAYEECIMPAHVMSEIKVHSLTTRILDELKIGNVENFLKETLTHSHRVNRFLPVICEMVQFPLVPDDVRGPLKKLTTCRDDLAHAGMIHEKTKISSKRDFAELLAAAFIFNHYLDLLEHRVDQWIAERNKKG
jgi:hypothetical protein